MCVEHDKSITAQTESFCTDRSEHATPIITNLQTCDFQPAPCYLPSTHTGSWFPSVEQPHASPTAPLANKNDGYPLKQRIVIESLQELIEYIDELQHRYAFEVPGREDRVQNASSIEYPKFIFRGHGNHEKYDMLPTILRHKESGNHLTCEETSQSEYSILYSFMSEASGIVPYSPKDIVPWLETAQHFGVPTRLLDFTTNPLVALYFTCKGSQEHDGAVWIVNETAYKRIFFGIDATHPTSPIPSDQIVGKIVVDEIVHQGSGDHSEPVRYIQYPWIYKPFYRDSRMTSQSSMFMLWAAKRKKLTDFMTRNNFMSKDPSCKNQAEGVLCHVIIPSGEKQKLLAQLDMCGVTERFIYPGLESIGRDIKRLYEV